MVELDARILTQPEIVSGPSHPAPINNGRILLDGELYRPVPISNLSITYFGIQSQEDEIFSMQFSKKLVEVSFRWLKMFYKRINLFILGYEKI